MKKQIILFGGISMFLALATGCLNQNATQTPGDATDDGFTATTVQERLDADTVVDAVERGNKELCNTVEKEEQKADCLVKVEDRLILEEVRKSGEIKKCMEIKQASTREKCEIIAKEIDEQVKKEKEIKEKYEELDKQKAEDEAKLDAILKNGPLTIEACEVIEDPEFKTSCINAATIVNNDKIQ